MEFIDHCAQLFVKGGGGHDAMFIQLKGVRLVLLVESVKYNEEITRVMVFF